MEYNLTTISKGNAKINKESLLSYRFDNGRGFPTSYINFITQYGYGLSCGLFLIYAPLEQQADSLFERAESIKSSYQDILDGKEALWFDLAPDLNYEQLKNLYPFAMSENGHYLFWDIESNPSLSEFDIYITDFRGMGFIKASSNLYDFFNMVTSAKRYQKVLPFSQVPLLATFEK